MTDLVVRRAASVYPMSGEGPVRGESLQSIHGIQNTDVWFDDGMVGGVGEAPDGAATSIDATGCTVVPGFVDCHTHLPFFGWRADEDAARLSGKRYETLHKEEGGIYRSARLLAQASDEEVLSFSGGLANAMLARGTTTFETKSGYGLSVDAELRQLRLARALSERVPQHVVTTCLACHAIPPNKSAGEWTGEAAEKLLPQAARDGLASACDIYVESIAFALEHAARLAEAAGDLGLRMRIHADQLEDGQAAAFAARWGFATADHLNHTSSAAVGDLVESGTSAVLLPGATFTLRQQKKPPVRNLLEEGAVVALGTDLNPGTSPVHSMPFVIALACRFYGMRPLEALAASTVNAAHALALGDKVGRLSPGFRGDAVVLDLPSFEQIAYRPDADPVVAVICGGRLAYVRAGEATRVADGG
jgi:imidazolonepropionase